MTKMGDAGTRACGKACDLQSLCETQCPCVKAHVCGVVSDGNRYHKYYSRSSETVRSRIRMRMYYGVHICEIEGSERKWLS